LELSFHNIEIRHICEDNSFALRKYGNVVAEKLKSRLSDMLSADSPLDLPTGDLLIYKNGEYYCCKIDLSEGYQLIFCQNHIKVPLCDSGEINWGKVSRVKILNINHNHA
jgi:hypothetical protein